MQGAILPVVQPVSCRERLTQVADSALFTTEQNVLPCTISITGQRPGQTLGQTLLRSMHAGLTCKLPTPCAPCAGAFLSKSQLLVVAANGRLRSLSRGCKCMQHTKLHQLVCCYRYNYVGSTCLDQLALCLISWLAAVCVSDLQSAFSVSGHWFNVKYNDLAGAQHCIALRCITMHCLALRIGV